MLSFVQAPDHFIGDWESLSEEGGDNFYYGIMEFRKPQQLLQR